MMQIATRPCPDRLPARFDFAPIDTCEEALFAPGADMLVRALVGDEANVRVTFSAMGHELDYVQNDGKVSGTLDGQAFTLTRTLTENGFGLAGETSGGPIQVNLQATETGSQVEGHAGTMGFRHALEKRDPSSGRLAVIRGKFD